MRRSAIVLALAYLFAAVVGASGAFYVVAIAPSEKISRFELYAPGMAPWQKRCFVDGINVFEQQNSDNLVMMKQRKFHGIWNSGFEDSSFREMSVDGQMIVDTRVAWLEPAEGSRPDNGNEAANLIDIERKEGRNFPHPFAVTIDFVGREALCDRRTLGYGFGHMAAFSRLIIMDKATHVERVK